MSRNKNFSASAIQHIYQRAADHGVIFYSTEDRLVYYTLAAANARKHHIVVLAASIMFTHTHQSLVANSLKSVRAYLHNVGTSFTRLYNHRYSRKGQLFERYPGRSQKLSTKDKRTNLIYVYNNHVEKGLCREAKEERWSLLPYAISSHPFSDEIVLKQQSSLFKRSVRLVDRRVRKMRGLEYRDLNRIMPSLSSKEREQFIDYIINSYALVDFKFATTHFGSLDKMVLAINSTTGCEYEIKEDYSKQKDTAYVELCKTINTERIYLLQPEECSDLMHQAYRTTTATKDQLKRFFHSYK